VYSNNPQLKAEVTVSNSNMTESEHSVTFFLNPKSGKFEKALDSEADSFSYSFLFVFDEIIFNFILFSFFEY